MGNCKSLNYVDEDDRIIKEREKQRAREWKALQGQLKKQRGQYSELDLTGRPRMSKEQIRIATNIIYDA